MIVLDTNVISEQLRPEPSQAVLAWLAQQDLASVTITAITVAETHSGIAIMPAGRRQRELYENAIAALGAFDGRVIPFTDECALHYAEVIAMRRAMGRPIGPQDAMIAAICRHHGATLATRNVDDFERIGLDLINPWDAPSGQDVESSGVR